MKEIVQTVFNLPKNILIWLVNAYRLLLSPWLGGDCRFEPTCSVYALQALKKHGAISGAALAACRIARCQPWCQGGHDPVPSAPLFTRLLTPSASTIQPKSNEKTAP